MASIKSSELIALLGIVDENIINTAREQPKLFVKAARYRVEKMRERARVGAELDVLKSTIKQQKRNKKDETGKKLPEAALTELMELDPRVQQLRAKSDDAYFWEELGKSILEAFRQRNSAIKIIAEAQQFEAMRESVSIEKDEQNRKLKNKARRLVDMRASLRSQEMDEG